MIHSQNLKIKIAAAFLCLAVISGTSEGAAPQKDKELFLISQKAFEDGFYDVAMRYIDQLLQEYPQTEKKIQAKLLLGQCYFFKSQYLKAYEIFQSLLQYPEYKDVTLFWLGETYLKGADYKQAEDHYTQLINLFPDSSYAAQAHYSLGWVYTQQNQYDKAIDIFKRFILKYPTNPLIEDAAFKLAETQYNLKNYPEAIKYFEDFVVKFPKSNRHAESYFYIAESYYYQENFLAAISYYAKAADIAYDNKLILMARVSMGWSYLKLKKYSLSQEQFELALTLGKEKGMISDDIYLGLASLYTEKGEFEKALGAYDQLINSFPDSKRNSDAYLGKATIYYQMENFNQAILTYQAFIDRFQNQEGFADVLDKAYFGLAWSYLKVGKLDESITIFQNIKNRSENNIIKVSALTQIGDAYQEVEQFEKALEIYDQILTEYPDSVYTDYVQYRQGTTLLKMNRLEAASLAFQSLQNHFPQSKYINDSKYFLAVTYFKKDDWKTAKNYIEEFLQNDPLNQNFSAEAHYILGLSQYNLEEYKPALETFQKIIKNFPHQTAIYNNAQINVAKCLYKSGNVPEALKSFKLLAVSQSETEIAEEALLWLGNHYAQSADWINSIAYYIKFLKEYPSSEKINRVLYELGQVYVSNGQFDQAVATFEKINDKDTEIFAKAKLAIAEIFSKELDPEAALKTYENIIASSPEYKRDAYMKMAEILKINKTYYKALEAYQEALKAPEGSKQWPSEMIRFYIADTHELLNEEDKALEEYLKIPYLYPNATNWIVKAYLRAARIFEEKENWQEAKTIYNKVIGYQTEELKFAQERLEWIQENISDIN